MDAKLNALRKKALALTKAKLKKAVTNDKLIIQTILNIDELGRVSNSLAKRLREWYELYNPEFSRSVKSHEAFVKLILQKSKKQLLKELNIEEEESMGANLSKEDLKPILELAKSLQSLFFLKGQIEKYLEQNMRKTCPNLTVLTGPLIGARLIYLAGSLRKMATISASNVQLLGAEKALFRHLRSGAKPPKYGILHEHPLILSNPLSLHGKIARSLADKISIAVKVDFFKGEFMGDKLKKELEKKIANLPRKV